MNSKAPMLLRQASGLCWKTGHSACRAARCYTLSIYLKEYFGAEASAWDTRVLATDISQQALAKARAGLYAVSPKIKSNVIFKSFNLMDPIRFHLKFDVIFCRNVMIYFNGETRDALVKRFHEAMLPFSYLFISHSESLGQNPLFRMAAPAIYQRR